MNKITTEFQDGQILHAADLNPLVTSINQAADELATKASQFDLDNTTSTANNALTAANNAATVAAYASETANNAITAANNSAIVAAYASETANNALTAANNAATVAADASETANDAYGLAKQTRSTAAQALATANSITTEEIPAIKESHYRYVRIVIVQNMPIQQTGTDTFDGVTYNTETKKFAFFKEVIPGQPPTLFANASGANELFQSELADGTWSAPKPNVLFNDGTNLYHGYGERLYQLTQTAI